MVVEEPSVDDLHVADAGEPLDGLVGANTEPASGSEVFFELGCQYGAVWFINGDLA